MQAWIVGLVVVLAAAYAIWYWLPASLRSRLGRLHESLGRAPGCNACQSACAGCDCAVSAPMPTSAPGAQRIVPIHPVPPSDD